MTLLDIPRAALLQITGTRIGGVPVLAPEGELDTWTVALPAWTTAVAEACADAGGEIVVLDLRRLYFLDAAGLTALEEFAAALRGIGRRLVLAGVRPRIREFLRYTCTNIAPGGHSVEDALASVAVRVPGLLGQAEAGAR
jgi:anti-anti-sigma factor